MFVGPLHDCPAFRGAVLAAGFYATSSALITHPMPSYFCSSCWCSVSARRSYAGGTSGPGTLDDGRRAIVMVEPVPSPEERPVSSVIQEHGPALRHCSEKTMSSPGDTEEQCQERLQHVLARHTELSQQRIDGSTPLPL